MKKRKKVILILLSCLIVVAALSLGVFFAVRDRLTVKLIGEESITLELGQVYTEQGCESFIGNVPVKNTSVNGNVDTSTPGVYKITYTSQFLSETAEAVRTIRVRDSISPVITAPEQLELTVGVKVENAVFEYSATDNYDGDITSRMTATYQDEKIVLCAADSSGNTATSEIKIIRIKDTVMPSITLSGSANTFLLYGEEYKEAGFLASDNIDGNITYRVSVSGTENLSQTGNHVITYSVTDSSDNTVEVKRNVFVYDSNSKNNQNLTDTRVIFLTFDDGPCLYTPKILEILDKYNIKTTFFVTNQKPDWQNCIAEAHNKGHTIGAHTYSHQYSIYKSAESYFEDLDAINEVIRQQTGSYTKLIRFPGGSSNAISKKYKRGIMSQLVKDVTEKGFIYFDWNIVSGDADSTPKKNDPQYIFSTVTNSLTSGINIVLMHDINPANLEALPQIIEYGLSNGYTFLPLDESSPTAHHTVLN